MTSAPASPPALEPSRPRLFVAEIVGTAEFDPVRRSVSLHTDEVVFPRPGQFLHAAFADDPAETPWSAPWMLRRPLTPVQVSAEPSGGVRFELVIGPTDPFHRRLMSAPAGTRISLMGPLGMGFPEIPADIPVLLVAEAAFAHRLWHAARLLTESGHFPVWLLDAGPDDLPGLPGPVRRTDEFLRTDEFRRTDPAARLTALLDRELDSRPGDRPAVLAAGSPAVLRAVSAAAAARGLFERVWLERPVPCATGACQGCVVPMRHIGPGRPRYRLCCTEGPVFDGSSIDWEQLPP